MPRRSQKSSQGKSGRNGAGVPTHTVITLPHRSQLEMLDNAVEILAQAYVGSFQELHNILSKHMRRDYPNYSDQTAEQRAEFNQKEDKLADLLSAVRDFVFPNLKGQETLQVRDDDVEEDARVAWDLHQVIKETTYRRSDVLRASRTCNLPRIHEERRHWSDLLQGIRGDLEGLATDSLHDYPTGVPSKYKAAAKEAAEVLTSCLTDTD